MKILIIIILILTDVCHQGVTEKVIKTWPNGQKKVTYKIYSGDTINLINVLYKAYYPNGQIFKTGTIKNGFEVGTWQYFYQSGKLKSVGQFTKGLNDGKIEVYYESGELEQKGNYQLGKLLDLTFFNRNGTIKSRSENLRHLLVDKPKKWTAKQIQEIKIDCLMAIEPGYSNADNFCNCILTSIQEHCNYDDIKALTENQRGIILEYLTTSQSNCWKLLEKKKNYH